MQFDLITLRTPSPVFYSALGPFLGNHAAGCEVGAPIEHRPGKVWVVALVDDEPIGCAGLHLPYGHTAELASAYVVPSRRWLGVYGAMLERRLEIARAACMTEVVATCQPQVTAMLRRRGWLATSYAAGLTTLTRAI
jgi:GNAT superfamily N-acetyltransferase